MAQIKRDCKGRSEEEFLADYTPRNYEKPSVTVDIVLITKTYPQQVLFIKRKNHPFLDMWAFPGGFVDIHEDLIESAYRELKEETAIEAISLTQFHTYGNVKRDPRMRVISIAYLAILPEQVISSAKDDAKDAQWFEIQQNDQTIDLINPQSHIRYERKNQEILHVEGYDALAFDHIQILIDALDEYAKHTL